MSCTACDNPSTSLFCMDCDLYFCDKCADGFHAASDIIGHRLVKTTLPPPVDGTSSASQSQAAPQQTPPSSSLPSRKRKRSDAESQNDSGQELPGAFDSLSSEQPSAKRQRKLSGRKHFELVGVTTRDAMRSHTIGEGLRFVQRNIVIRPMDLVFRAEAPDVQLVVVDCFTTGNKKPKFHCRVFNPASQELTTVPPSKLNPGNCGRANDSLLPAIEAAISRDVERGRLRKLQDKECAARDTETRCC